MAFFDLSCPDQNTLQYAACSKVSPQGAPDKTEPLHRRRELPDLNGPVTGMNMKLSTVLTSLTLSAMLSFGVASAQAAPDVLRAGIEAAYAPFEYIDEQTQELTGFDVELIRAIADAQNVRLEITTMPFDALIPSIISNSLDCVLSAITITEERKRRVAFSTPYYEAGLSILIRASDSETVKGPEDLKDQSICVQIGTTGADYAQTIEGANVKQYNSAPDSYIELHAGGCLAVINDNSVNDYYLGTDKAIGIAAIQGKLTSEFYGIAMNKSRTDIQDLVNEGFKKIVESGKYAELYRKWFGTDPAPIKAE